MKKDNKTHKIKSDKHGEYFDHRKDFKKEHSIKNFSILPHPTTIESYEAISPGITEKLGTMFIKEQEFRHRLEVLKVKGSQSIYRFGQLLSAVIAVIVIFVTLFIYNEYNDRHLATVICVSGFAFLTIVNVFSMRKATQTKHFMRHSHKNN